MFFRSIIPLSVLLLSLSFSASAVNNSNDLRLNTIVVDAGHGGKDAGTISADRKTFEKSLSLKIAKKFAAKVREAYPEMKVVMTRDKDEFVPLNKRARIATDAGAGLFISIHINAMPKGNRSTNGFASYILGTSKKYDSYDVNMEVCRRENSVIYLEDDYSTTYKDFDSSPEARIMLQLMQRAYREQSLRMAEQVSMKMSNGPFAKSMGVMQGNFAVLRLASMPAVLLEFGFMSNPDDLSVLRSEEKLDRMVDNLFKAFSDYKSEYDSSVSLSPADEAVKTVSESVTEPEKKAVNTSAYYGTQVLSSGKPMSPTDPFFQGHMVDSVKIGSVYKYILEPDEDIEKAKNQFKKLRLVYKGCFLVKVENGTVSIAH